MDSLRVFRSLIASDPNVSDALKEAFTECDWDGCKADNPVSANGLSIAPKCYPAYRADQAESGFDHSGGIDPDGPEADPESTVRKLRMRKQAQREAAAELGIEDVA